MAQTVQITCAHCGHTQMYVVESAENDEPVEQGASVSRNRVSGDTLTAAEVRPRRLESLPTSLPVGGIITPV